MSGYDLYSWLPRAPIVLATLLLAACGDGLLCESKTLHEMTSFDGKVDAIVTTHDCGATTSTGYSVYLVPHGAKTEDKSPVFVADKVEGLQVKWIRDRWLTIKYERAHIFNFSNFWYLLGEKGVPYEVAITEVAAQPPMVSADNPLGVDCAKEIVARITQLPGCPAPDMAR